MESFALTLSVVGLRHTDTTKSQIDFMNLTKLTTLPMQRKSDCLVQTLELSLDNAHLVCSKLNSD